MDQKLSKKEINAEILRLRHNYYSNINYYKKKDLPIPQDLIDLY